MDDLSRPLLSSAPALFGALPAAAARFAWMSLGAFPTPVERVDGLLPSTVELWVKREDQSAAAYGGNKVRKLEFLLGAARARGCRRLVTFGGTGSHHVAATAIHGARAGFAVEAVLTPQPLDAHVRELLLAEQATGATLHGVRSYLDVVPWRLRAGPGWLPGGGSSALGTLGWVSGGLEIAVQIETGALPPPDVMYAALGSGGTVAGLWRGLVTPHRIELVAVRVVGGLACGELATRALAWQAERLLVGLGALPGRRPRLRVEERFLPPGYGRANPASRAATALAARAGLKLDPIYTGKVLAAVLADARTGRLDGKRVLVLHSFSGADLAPLVARAPGADRLPPRLRALFSSMPVPSSAVPPST